jgi:hypothetical protein
MLGRLFVCAQFEKGRPSEIRMTKSEIRINDECPNEESHSRRFNPGLGLLCEERLEVGLRVADEGFVAVGFDAPGD